MKNEVKKKMMIEWRKVATPKSQRKTFSSRSQQENCRAHRAARDCRAAIAWRTWTERGRGTTVTRLQREESGACAGLGERRIPALVHL
jgi:hypothetical protein